VKPPEPELGLKEPTPTFEGSPERLRDAVPEPEAQETETM